MFLLVYITFSNGAITCFMSCNALVLGGVYPALAYAVIANHHTGKVCDAPEKPIIVCSDEISHTKRRRAHRTNIDVPDGWRGGIRPRDHRTTLVCLV